MKKSNLAVLALLFLATSVFAKKTVIIKHDKGPHGYNYVYVEETLFKKTLICKDPGNIQCSWNSTQIVVGNSGDIPVETIINWVEYMAVASPTGNNIEYGSTGIIVSWEYDSTTGDITIEIDDVA